MQRLTLRKVPDKSGTEPPRDEQGKLAQPWPLKHVEVLAAPDRQVVSPGWIEGGITAGWLAIDGHKVTIKARPKKVVYEITAFPGRYCCFDGEKLPDDERGVQARLHVASEHAGEESPDDANPSGYRCDNYYVLEKVSG